MNNTSLGLWGLLDSRASSHMFSEQNCFTSYTEAYDGQLVTVGSLNHIPVVGYRSVSFYAKLPFGQIILVILWNVLHVPSLGTNLVSLGILQHKGASYSSWGDGIVISIGGQELFHTILKNTDSFLYFITCAKDTNHTAFFVYEGSMRLWHCQIGHIGPRIIDLIEQKDFVNRLDLKAPNDYDYVCTGCAHGKSHWKTILGTSKTKYGKMELVIIDLTDLILVPT